MKAPVRLFIALPVSPGVRRALAEAQAVCRTDGVRAAWTPPENLHLTLCFLGDTPVWRLPDYNARLDEAAADISPFHYEVRGVGTFGPARAPRVLWAGVPEPPEALNRLAATVDARFGGGMPDHARRPHRFHVTLGRLRGPSAALTSALRTRMNKTYGLTCVRCVQMVQSILHAEGAEHRAVHESQLKGA